MICSATATPQARKGERERERNNRAVEAAAIWPSIRSTLEKRNEIPRANRNTNHGYYELVIYVREGKKVVEWKERERGKRSEWEWGSTPLGSINRAAHTQYAQQ